ncbi:DUF2637 domain-containing protein [Streptomyces sp. NPDC001698]|uniref:DUF2637 domain-containing protein n=1 Tax=Streptomyces sp. NPDC001698 TaxID=3364601 RepID=UPI0036780DC9
MGEWHVAAGKSAIPQLTRAHRVLVSVVVAGAVIIAGIGFAGSYAAVRELAVKQGFGTFSYVFPIGIDAGICVLLALDLLLTWIRIPFPLLRQTAWLLTAATIAFNGAAAWPDPLGVGMHAVIPVLFVVAVEAARHAIGRIADITADKHMEGVRLTRWLLSPIPTFLLWRRMKLWELRSYDQVIKLEQERLVYQASLRSRFGRAWRRKAPVESLMPLRLARYGVPLAETAPAGLAAAGIDDPPIQFTVERARVPAQRESPELEAAVDQEKELARVRGVQYQPVEQLRTANPEQPHDLADEGSAQHLANAYQDWMAAFGFEPTSAQFAQWLQDQYGIATAAGGPLSDELLEPLLRLLKQRHTPSAENGTDPQAPHDADDGWGDYFYHAWLACAQDNGAYPDAAALATYVYERDQITGANGQPITGEDLEVFVSAFRQREFDETEPPAGEEATEPAAQAPSGESFPNEDEPEGVLAGAGAQPTKEQRRPRVSAAIDDPAGEDDASEEPAALTTVDRYYLAWTEYQTELGEEPRSGQLSAYLASKKGMNGRGGKPVSPSTLRRYLLPFRVYNVWAEQRVRNETPSLDAIAEGCAALGITAQHNKPLTTDYIAEQAVDFERRWQALIRHHAQSQQ